MLFNLCKKTLHFIETLCKGDIRDIKQQWSLFTITIFLARETLQTNALGCWQGRVVPATEDHVQIVQREKSTVLAWQNLRQQGETAGSFGVHCLAWWARKENGVTAMSTVPTTSPTSSPTRWMMFVRRRPTDRVLHFARLESGVSWWCWKADWISSQQDLSAGSSADVGGQRMRWTFMTLLINTSLSTGCFPAKYKHAVVTPLLKKHNLDAVSYTHLTLPTKRIV